MKRTMYAGIRQGTSEWEDVRRGKLTASVFKDLITLKTVEPAKNPKSRMLTNLLVSERITGRTEYGGMSEDMKRGHDDEIKARRLYSLHIATVTQVGFMTVDTGDAVIGYSPDGLVGDDGLIEAKSRLPKHHLAAILDDAVPDEHMPQLQAALLVSGRPWIDYISYCEGMPLWVKRVTPDEKWQTAILTASAAFEKAAAAMQTDYEQRTQGLIPTSHTSQRDPRAIF